MEFGVDARQGGWMELGIVYEPIYLISWAMIDVLEY
jgi:hypothetical protein